MSQRSTTGATSRRSRISVTSPASRTGSRLRVGVIGGGQNCEHEVSLASAAAVATALDRTRYEIVSVTIGTDGQWRSANGRLLGASMATSLAAAIRVMGECDVVLPIVHGPHGEDGSLAAVLELAGVPYVGSGVRAGALAMDKWATKLVAQAIGVRTAPGVLVTPATAGSLVYETPVVVKPVAAGSSHGVSMARSAGELAAALDLAFGLDHRVLVEERIEGREIDVAVLDRPGRPSLAGPALEISLTPGALFDTERKYGGGSIFQIPASLTDPERKEIEIAALALHEALGCAGVARYDFFWTDRGLVLNEVNTMPGMTEHSQVPAMFAAAGVPYADLLTLLVDGAIRHSRAGERR